MSDGQIIVSAIKNLTTELHKLNKSMEDLVILERKRYYEDYVKKEQEEEIVNECEENSD